MNIYNMYIFRPLFMVRYMIKQMLLMQDCADKVVLILLIFLQGLMTHCIIPLLLNRLGLC